MHPERRSAKRSGVERGRSFNGAWGPHTRSMRLRAFERRLAPFDFLQVPYGRSRPIDFTRSHFSAQQLDDHELQIFMAEDERALGGKSV